MNEAAQKKIDRQLSKGNTPAKAHIVEVAAAPLLSFDDIQRDQREIEIVEINFRDMSARIVEKSNAPKLTKKFLKEKGKPIKSVEFFFDNGSRTVYVHDGIPLSVETERNRLLNSYDERLAEIEENAKHDVVMEQAGKQHASDSEPLPTGSYNELTETVEYEQENGETATKICYKDARLEAIHVQFPTAGIDSEAYRKLNRDRTRASLQLMTARMIAKPMFSFGGVGDGEPIEETKLLFNDLYDAFVAANYPEDDQIFQVECLRSIPFETAVLLGQGFEAYPLGVSSKRLIDLSERDLADYAAHKLAQRRILVASMINWSGGFSYNGVGSKKNAFPVEDLCERFLETLHNAYKVVTIPEERLLSLRRFPVVGDGDRTGQSVDSEPVEGDGESDDASGGDLP